MELGGKTAVVTGGASGMGLATARRFAEVGANLVLGDIELGPLEEAIEGLRASGARVVGLTCDVAVEEDVIALREAALREFGAVHLVFNNAGVAGGSTIGTPKAMWDWVLGVNLDGVVNGINAFVPHFLDQDEGHVGSTASLAGLGGVPYMGPYCASKFAVVGISESLFHELALRGSRVGVSVLCPGFVRTRIHESARNAPEDLKALGEDPELARFADVIAEVVNAGLDPSEVALAVESAVRENRFWILPHMRAALGTTAQRLEWMRGGPAPTVDLAAATRG
ncbi:MAG: SDR family NAD(P)-dependent oxidoreductase [Acidobacteriota bacterium]|nr:SDR family NAD(P)-dependent oxidoreductase [Acidobacteriota bacterium]